MLLSAAALRVLRVRDIDPDAPPPHRIRRAVGAVGACCLVASVGLALAPMRAGPVDCGGLHIPSPSLPQNEFGNIDPGCIDRYQGRSTLVVIVAALGLALVVGSRLRSTQRSPRPTRLTAWVALITVALGATLSSIVVVIDRFEFYSGAG
jgi:hypothetical protein